MGTLKEFFKRITPKFRCTRLAIDTLSCHFTLNADSTQVQVLREERCSLLMDWI